MTGLSPSSRVADVDASPRRGLDDDLRPRMAKALARREPFSLVTVFAADGGPRGVGAQMVVTQNDRWGFVSGGCIEADVAIHGRSTLTDGQARHLVYGRGSPWIDTRLPCGGRLDLLVERIDPDDEPIKTLVDAYESRRTVRYQSDGGRRRCLDHIPIDDLKDWVVDHVFVPTQRIIVVGSDPIALAIASLGARLGWAAALIWPHGPMAHCGSGVVVRRDSALEAIAELATDDRTAIAIATHDEDADETAIVAALGTPAGYIGVLGARRRIENRIARLRACGISDDSVARLHMPIGLPIGASAPWEIAVSVAAGVVAARRSGGTSL